MSPEGRGPLKETTPGPDRDPGQTPKNPTPSVIYIYIYIYIIIKNKKQRKIIK